MSACSGWRIHKMNAITASNPLKNTVDERCWFAKKLTAAPIVNSNKMPKTTTISGPLVCTLKSNILVPVTNCQIMKPASDNPNSNTTSLMIRESALFIIPAPIALCY